MLIRITPKGKGIGVFDREASLTVLRERIRLEGTWCGWNPSAFDRLTFEDGLSHKISSQSPVLKDTVLSLRYTSSPDPTSPTAPWSFHTW